MNVKPIGNDIIHHISPFFVPVIGFVVSLIVGNIVSLLTKGNKDKRLDKKLINVRVCYYMEKVLPKSWRQLENDRPVPSRLRHPPHGQVISKPMTPQGSNRYFCSDRNEDEVSEDQQSTSPLSVPYVDKNTSL